MERVFTKDVGRNFKRGDVREYPVAVWLNIQRAAKQPMDRFSRPVTDIVKDATAKSARA